MEADLLDPEPPHLAVHEPERPAPELLALIRQMASKKWAQKVEAGASFLPAGVGGAGGGAGGADADEGQGGGAAGAVHLQNRFDDSAAVAIGVVLEELVRGMMMSWKKRDYQKTAAAAAAARRHGARQSRSSKGKEKIPATGPLLFSMAALKREIQLQLQGSCVEAVTPDMLRKRLEVKGVRE